MSSASCSCTTVQTVLAEMQHPDRPRTPKCRRASHILLLPNGTLVESKLFALQNVTIHTTTLAGPGCYHSEQTTSLELALKRCLNFAGGLGTLSLLLLNALALLRLLWDISLLLASAAQRGTVVSLVPLSEWRGVDLNDGRLGKGVRADEFVVRRMEGHSDDADLAGDALAAPGEVAGVETQGAEFAVAAASADEVDSLGTDTGVGGLTTLLESSGCASEKS